MPFYRTKDKTIQAIQHKQHNPHLVAEFCNATWADNLGKNGTLQMQVGPVMHHLPLNWYMLKHTNGMLEKKCEQCFLNDYEKI